MNTERGGGRPLMGLPKDGEQGCLFVQKTEFSVFGLILSCHPILQEFSVVRIDINPPLFS